MKRLLFILSLLLLIAAACGSDAAEPISSGGTGGGDEPRGAGPYPIADLTVTYEHPDVGTIAYQLVCLGDTATLLGDIDGVDDQRACAALADGAVQTRLIQGQPTGIACTEIYGGPETARFVGTIDQQAVDTTVDRANGCGIDDWDRVLADLLPAPRPFA